MRFIAVIFIVFSGTSALAACIGVMVKNLTDQEIHVNFGDVKARKEEGLLYPFGYKKIKGAGEACFKLGFRNGIWVSTTTPQKEIFYNERQVKELETYGTVKITMEEGEMVVKLTRPTALFPGSSEETLDPTVSRHQRELDVDTQTCLQIYERHREDELATHPFFSKYVPTSCGSGDEGPKIRQATNERREKYAKTTLCVDAPDKASCVADYVAKFSTKFAVCCTDEASIHPQNLPSFTWDKETLKTRFKDYVVRLGVCLTEASRAVAGGAIFGGDSGKCASKEDPRYRPPTK